MQARITKGTRKYGKLKALMKSKYICGKTQQRIYTTVIRPTTTVACETDAKSTEHRKVENMETWKGKMLQATCGGVRTKEGWRKIINHELADLYKTPSIITVVKAQKVRCLDHVKRLDVRTITKLVLRRKPIGKK